jgi:PAS domain S-box-containing protein
MMMDPEGMITYWNPAAERVLGYTQEEAIGRNLHRLIAPERFHAAHQAAFPKFLETGRGEAMGKTLELVARRKNGDEIPVELSLSAFFMNGWQSVGLLRDISERKHAEKELLQLHRKNQLILDATDEGIIGLDSAGKITFVNPYATQTLGYSIDELIGEQLHPLVHHSKPNGDRYPLSECPMYESLRLGMSSRIRDEVLWKKDGTSFPAIYSSIPITEYGNIVGVVITFRDITQRKRAEERIRQQNEELRNANNAIESLYERVHREYELAEEVFARVTNTDYSQFPNIRHVSLPVAAVGGDLLLVAPKPSGGMNVLLGDFTGHGLSATIGLIPVTNLFHTMSAKDYPISGIIAEMNNKLCALLPTGLFFCACFLELNRTHDCLTVWNGGMPDALLVGTRGEIKQRFSSTSLPLGIVDSARLKKNGEVVRMGDGDAVYVYSDGLIEVCNAQGEMYGQEGFERSFQRKGDDVALFDQIMNDFMAFHGDSPRSDDVFLAEIKCGALGEIAQCEAHGFGPKSPTWKMSVELGPDDFRSDPLQFLITMMMEVWELRRHKENVHLILSELLSNALDYGVLGLDPALRRTPEGFGKFFSLRQNALETLGGGWIKIDVQHVPRPEKSMLLIRMEDSGPGFDHSRIDERTLTDNLTCRGRGIQLVRSMCKALTYNKKGNCAEAVYVWESC